jgi:hypothetical protein
LLPSWKGLVAQFSRQEDGRWLFNDYQGEEEILHLISVDWQISFLDLYQRVDFESDEELNRAG